MEQHPSTRTVWDSSEAWSLSFRANVSSWSSLSSDWSLSSWTLMFSEAKCLAWIILWAAVATESIKGSCAMISDSNACNTTIQFSKENKTQVKYSNTIHYTKISRTQFLWIRLPGVSSSDFGLNSGNFQDLWKMPQAAFLVSMSTHLPHLYSTGTSEAHPQDCLVESRLAQSETRTYKLKHIHV